MSHELLKQVAAITNKKTTKLSAIEVFELQICASVLDFIDDVGSVEELRTKVNTFLKGKKWSTILKAWLNLTHDVAVDMQIAVVNLQEWAEHQCTETPNS